MNLFFRFLLVSACWCSFAFANEGEDYAAKKIPADLLLHANAVMRVNQTEIDIVSPQEVNVTRHYAITILNEKGDVYANCTVPFSKLNSIDNISGYIYDANGGDVKKIKKSDFNDMPATLNPGEFEDEKMKIYRVGYKNYPYTVEYVIETKQNHTFYIPEWAPVPDIYCALQSGELTVKTHGTTDLKYKQYHIEATPVVSQGDAKQYKWTVNNIHAVKREALSYDGGFDVPVILFAINDFMLDDYKGSSRSWKDFGQFVYQLNKGRDLLPGDVKVKIRQLVANAKDDHEKVKILYAYLQKTMRYVSVQYGIGGWQTLDAQFLSKNQYGDCKALSNYMMAMLKEVGIQANPVLIMAGADNQSVLTRDFVCQQFDHVILCVPFAKDTVWLECTSGDLPANYLSDFTQNRDALMITPEGGVVVHTPVYDASVNKVSRSGLVTCNEDGSLKIKMKSFYKGEAADHLSYQLKYDNDHDKAEYLHSKFHLASYSLDDYKYEKIENAPVTCMNEDASLTATGMYTKTGNRSFLSLDIAPVDMPMPDEEDERKSKFYLPESLSVSDTFEVQLPDKYDVEYIPAPVSVKYPFGSYSCSIVKNDNKLFVTTSLAINNGIYEPAQYQDYVKLTNIVNSRANKKVVLKNKS